MRQRAVVLFSLLLAAAVTKAAVLNGFVLDAQTGTPIPYASVCLAGTNRGAASDRDGYYVLRNLPDSAAVVEFSNVGYRPAVCTLDLDGAGTRRLDVRLAGDPVPVPGVTSSAARERSRREVNLGVRRLSLRDLRSSPALIDPDLFRAFQSLPGVAAVSDFSSALYVRGGSPDQNAVLLDGMPVQNPYHLSGLFSTFVIDALSSAELHAGAFPAEYGGAVSSVLDVRTRQGNSKKFSGRWNVGLLSSRAVIEGPLPGGSFIVAGRRAYTNVATALMAKMTKDSLFNLPYYFHEVQGRIDFSLSPRDRISLTGFLGRDRIDTLDAHYDAHFNWGNGLMSLRWNHILAPGLVVSTQAGHSASDASLQLKYDDWWREGIIDDRFTTYTSYSCLRSSIDWSPDSIHAWRAGVEGGFHNVGSRRFEDTTVYWQLHARPACYALHAGDCWRPNPKLLIQPGLRVECFTGGTYVRVSPRLSAKYSLRKDLALSAGTGRYHQYLSTPFPRHELLLRAPTLFFQQLVPADSALAPVWADHLMLGAEKWLGAGLQITAEAYYKRMGSLLETNINYDPSTDPNFDPLNLNPLYLVRQYPAIQTGTGRAAGLDLLLRSSVGWVGYSLAVARRRFLGDEFYPVYDARHTVNLTGTVSLGRGWSLALQRIFRTGFPDTGPVSWFQNVTVDPRTGSRYFTWKPIRADGLRYPAYHRLDAGIDKRFRLLGLEWTAYLQVVNVYARRNVLWYTYSRDGTRKPYVLVPAPIPSLGLEGSF